jgi:hypothetical protein
MKKIIEWTNKFYGIHLDLQSLDYKCFQVSIVQLELK